MRNTLVAGGILVLLGAAAFGVMPGIGGRGPDPPPSSAAALVLSHELMSPFCPGLTLAACPSPAAYDLRLDIRARLERGETPEAITASLIDRYGTGIKGTPPASGLGLAVWIVPGVVGLGLIAAVRTVGHRNRRPTRDDPPMPAHGSGRLFDQLDDELDQMG